MDILICGYGFTTQFLVSHFHGNYKILTRDITKVPEPLLYKKDSDFYPDIVIDSIPPVFNEKKNILNPMYKETLMNLYNRKKFVYVHISSTSIYPEIDGEWNEMSEVPFLNERGKLRWELEEKILETFPYALIVRAGGIYGKDRNLVLSLKKGDYRMLPKFNKIVARIHVYDLCQILLHGGKTLLEAGIERSLFKGYKRNNVILAIEPKGVFQQEVLDYIKNQFLNTISVILEPSKTTRILKSLYTESLINFKYPDIFLGLQDVEK